MIKFSIMNYFPPQVKYSYKWRQTGIWAIWDSYFCVTTETHGERQRKPKTDGRTAIQTEEWEARREEWMMRGGRADVWGPPCLPTMSSSPRFPHLSVSLPLALLRFSSSLPCFSLFFCCYFSPLALLLSVCFFLYSFGHTPFFTSLCFYSCLFAASHLFSWLLSFLLLDLSFNSVHGCCLAHIHTDFIIVLKL